MRKNYYTAGLDQLGPTPRIAARCLSECLPPFPHHPGLSIKNRAHLSTVNRKVKITLPRISCLERPPEAD